MPMHHAADAGTVMDYWFYENWRVQSRGKARIHKGPCSFCNHGQGTNKQKPRGNGNGEWRGPYKTIAAVNHAAVKTKRPVTRCKHCNP